jgi:hypothetical protein
MSCVLSDPGYAGFYQQLLLSWGDRVTITFWAEPHFPAAQSHGELWATNDDQVACHLRLERTENGWNLYSATMQAPDREFAPTLANQATRVGIAAFMRGSKPVHIDDVRIYVEHAANELQDGR